MAATIVRLNAAFASPLGDATTSRLAAMSISLVDAHPQRLTGSAHEGDEIRTSRAPGTKAANAH
jgi:hypothetical protein